MRLAAPTPESLVFRPLVSAVEVDAALRIRRRRYADTPDLHRLVCHDGGRDAFDRVSEHFGVFAGSRADSPLWGTIRLTEANRRIVRSGLPLLPLLEYTPSPAHDEVLDLIERVRSRRGRAFELSRMVIDEGIVRSDPGRARRALLVMVAGIAAELRRRSPWGVCFVTCSERRAAGYRRFGFEFLERGSSVLTPRLGRVSRVLAATPALMPASLAIRIADPLVQRGEVEYRTSNSYSTAPGASESAAAWLGASSSV
jgi:hypothetical protein